MIIENPATNRLALISIVTAFLTVLSFCIGFVPIPMTALVCYPTSVILGMTALVTGIAGLRQVKAGNGEGRLMAISGIWVGSLTMIAVLCFTTITLVSLPFLLNWARDGLQFAIP